MEGFIMKVLLICLLAGNFALAHTKSGETRLKRVSTIVEEKCSLTKTEKEFAQSVIGSISGQIYQERGSGYGGSAYHITETETHEVGATFYEDGDKEVAVYTFREKKPEDKSVSCQLVE
jgi:hypothetical protein